MWEHVCHALDVIWSCLTAYEKGMANCTFDIINDGRIGPILETHFRAVGLYLLHYR